MITLSQFKREYPELEDIASLCNAAVWDESVKVLDEMSANNRLDEIASTMALENGWEAAYDYLSDIERHTPFEFAIIDGEDFHRISRMSYDYWAENVYDWLSVCEPVVLDS